jgi:class 3 adenylate cyclase
MADPCLEWTDERGQNCCLEVVDKVFIGRSCHGIQATKRIIVNDPAVSRDHAYISLMASGLKITDMSRNGVWVNGVRVAAGSSRHLMHGDTIRVGSTMISVKCRDLVSIEHEPEATESLPIPLIVTNLVADVRRFSSMSQQEDSYNVYTLIRDIFDTLSTVVRDHGGTVKDYAGDAIYAFWEHGATVKKAQAHAACRAAIAQSKAIERLRCSGSSQIDLPSGDLQMGWGITTGKVTMAHYSRRVADLALVGDCTNLAFRLSGMAHKDLFNEMIMCSQTANLVKDALPIVDLGLVSVRGRSGWEHVYGIQ